MINDGRRWSCLWVSLRLTQSHNTYVCTVQRQIERWDKSGCIASNFYWLRMYIRMHVCARHALFWAIECLCVNLLQCCCGPGLLLRPKMQTAPPGKARSAWRGSIAHWKEGGEEEEGGREGGGRDDMDKIMEIGEKYTRWIGMEKREEVKWGRCISLRVFGAVGALMVASNTHLCFDSISSIVSPAETEKCNIQYTKQDSLPHITCTLMLYNHARTHARTHTHTHTPPT